jgi:hypothetical protein
MKGERGLIRLGECFIGLACRRLPAKTRDERYREWTAELPAILDDPDVRFTWHRATRMVRYSAGIAWQFSRPSRQQTRRLMGEAWFLFSLGLLVFDIWTMLRNPRSWELYLSTALGITTVALFTISWIVGRSRERQSR